jgi:hypothetical protein
MPSDPASLLATVAALRSQLDALESAVRADHPDLPASPTPPRMDLLVAPDDDLDSQWGNPEIRRDPPRWSGPSFVGAKYSDTTPEYLNNLADFLEWKAREADKNNETANNGKPRSQYVRKDAARARGWSRRLAEKKAPRRPTNPTGRGSMADEAEEGMPF